jgi:hypothetical protein
MSLMKTALGEMLQVLLGKHEESSSVSASEVSNPASVDTEKKKRGKKTVS